MWFLKLRSIHGEWLGSTILTKRRSISSGHGSGIRGAPVGESTRNSFCSDPKYFMAEIGSSLIPLVNHKNSPSGSLFLLQKQTLDIPVYPSNFPCLYVSIIIYSPCSQMSTWMDLHNDKFLAGERRESHWYQKTILEKFLHIQDWPRLDLGFHQLVTSSSPVAGLVHQFLRVHAALAPGNRCTPLDRFFVRFFKQQIKTFTAQTKQRSSSWFTLNGKLYFNSTSEIFTWWIELWTFMEIPQLSCPTLIFQESHS